MPTSRQVSTSRTIAADRQALFDVLADPAMHPVIDGSGTVRGPARSTPTGSRSVAGSGWTCGWGPATGSRTRSSSSRRAAIAWRHFSGHRWRYELEDVDGGTRVTETFDWSQARSKLALELAGFPQRNLAAMRRTLVRLDQLVTPARSTGRSAA
jgi:hypothetical protein